MSLIFLLSTIKKCNYNSETRARIRETFHRSSHLRCSIKRAFLKISQMWQENTCVGLFIKKRLQHRCFPVNFAKFLRTLILKNSCQQLLNFKNNHGYASGRNKKQTIWTRKYLRVCLADHVKSWKKMNVSQIMSEKFLRMCKFLQNISYYYEQFNPTGEKSPWLQRPSDRPIRIFVLCY